MNSAQLKVSKIFFASATLCLVALPLSATQAAGLDLVKINQTLNASLPQVADAGFSHESVEVSLKLNDRKEANQITYAAQSRLNQSYFDREAKVKTVTSLQFKKLSDSFTEITYSGTTSVNGLEILKRFAADRAQDYPNPVFVDSLIEIANAKSFGDAATAIQSIINICKADRSKELSAECRDSLTQVTLATGGSGNKEVLRLSYKGNDPKTFDAVSIVINLANDGLNIVSKITASTDKPFTSAIGELTGVQNNDAAAVASTLAKFDEVVARQRAALDNDFVSQLFR